jgi:hypothetical protein
MKDTRNLIHLDEERMSPIHRYYLLRAMLIALFIAVPIFIAVAGFIGWLFYR